MRTLIAIGMAAVLLSVSSCGLFNRTVTRDKLESVSSSSAEVTKSSTSNSSVSSRDITESRTVRQRPGKPLNASGNINQGIGILRDSAGYQLVAILDSLTGHLTVVGNLPGEYESTWQRGLNSTDSTGSSESRQDSTGNQSESQSEKNMNKDSNPSFWGTVALWIGIAIFVIAGVWIFSKTVLKR